MIKLMFPLPDKLTVALSGGVDSVAIVDFLSKKHKIDCAFYHHGTENSDRAFEFVQEFCGTRGIALHVGMLTAAPPAGVSPEEFWRNNRYKFLDTLAGPVITAHNLDDCVETYVWSSLHGTAKVIPAMRNNVLRPFLTTPKSELIRWCTDRSIAWCEDNSNSDTKYIRNYVRHELMPHALHVNPGLSKVVSRIVQRNLAAMWE